jgi:two-component system, cell cycle response regulator DivK
VRARLDSARQEPPLSVMPDAATKRPTVLVIEDNPLNSGLVTDLLEVNGIEVRSAETAEAGIQLAHELMPDLVLMDINLPGMDGLSATKILKSDPATRHLAVVGLTAHAMNGDAELARDGGFDGYLTKPFDTRTFVARIKSFIASDRK